MSNFFLLLNDVKIFNLYLSPSLYPVLILFPNHMNNMESMSQFNVFNFKILNQIYFFFIPLILILKFISYLFFEYLFLFLMILFSTLIFLMFLHVMFLFIMSNLNLYYKKSKLSKLPLVYLLFLINFNLHQLCSFF